MGVVHEENGVRWMRGHDGDGVACGRARWARAHLHTPRERQAGSERTCGMERVSGQYTVEKRGRGCVGKEIRVDSG